MTLTYACKTIGMMKLKKLTWVTQKKLFKGSVRYSYHCGYTMMTSSNGRIFRVPCPLCAEFTGHRWIPLKNGQWRGSLMFSLICTWINGWVNNREAGDLRRHCAHYDVIVMLHSGSMYKYGSQSRPYNGKKDIFVHICTDPYYFWYIHIPLDHLVQFHNSV